MEAKSSKIINIYFFSTHGAGITSILNRIMYNKFEDNYPTEKKSYQYKIFSGENFVTVNFHEQNLEILNDLDITTENIIIYVYDLNKGKSFDSLNPINEAIKSILGDNLRSVKVGIIGNKLDLISQNDKKTLKEIGEKYAQKINARFLMTSAKKGLDDIFQFILSIINTKSKNEIFIKNNKSILKEYQQLFKSKNLNGVIRC
jgi:GTPase SAR1 family protein